MTSGDPHTPAAHDANRFAWLEATGLINSHAPDCFRRREVARKTLRPKG